MNLFFIFCLFEAFYSIFYSNHFPFALLKFCLKYLFYSFPFLVLSTLLFQFLLESFSLSFLTFLCYILIWIFLIFVLLNSQHRFFVWIFFRLVHSKKYTEHPTFYFMKLSEGMNFQIKLDANESFQRCNNLSYFWIKIWNFSIQKWPNFFITRNSDLNLALKIGLC